MSVLDVLVGKKINELWMSDNDVQMTFVTDDGEFSFCCDADCCSESWINHINFVECLLGGTVESVDDIDMFSLLGVEPAATRQEYDQVLFHRIFTDRGSCTIEFRNSSNGYYGGSLEPWNGSTKSKQITEDF